MKKNFTLLIILILALSMTQAVFSQSGWSRIPFDFTREFYNPPLYDVKFSDSLNGWVFGSSGMYKSNDGGITWENKYKIRYISQWSSTQRIAYLEKDTVYIANYPYLYRSFDGGETWDSLQTTGFYIGGAFFINKDLGWALTEDSFPFSASIFKTTDGGKTWELKLKQDSSTINIYFSSVYFPSENNGFAAGIFGAIYRTTDGGESWSKNKINNGTLFTVFFTDTSYGWTAGYNGAILATTDGGKSWNAQNSGVQTTLNSIFFTNRNHGIAVGNAGKILSTTDGGLTWINNSEGSRFDFYNVTFINDEIGWAVGGKDLDSAVIYKTYSGGILSAIDDGGIEPQRFLLYQNYPNPFNPTTTIRYAIPSSVNGHSSLVQLKIYNILGEAITTLVNEKQAPGRYTVKFNANNLASGVYIYRLKINNGFNTMTQTRKMVLMK